MTSEIAIRLAGILPGVPPLPTDEVLHVTGHWWPGFILWLPLISLVLCGLCAAFKVRSKLPAWITVVSLACSFVLTVLLAYAYGKPRETANAEPMISMAEIEEARQSLEAKLERITDSLESDSSSRQLAMVMPPRIAPPVSQL